MNSALLVIDTDGCITACNPPAELILGERADALARPLGCGVGSQATRRAKTGSRARSRRACASAARRALITRADGTRVPIGISCAPIVDADGARLGVVATFQDLTEIKQLQRQVLQAEKMASIGQLAAGVAHEINNPMGFIHANLFQMAEYVADLRRVFSAVDELRKAVAQRRLRPRLREAAGRLDASAEETQVDFLLSDLAKAIRESQEGSERIRHIVQDLRDFSHHGHRRARARRRQPVSRFDGQHRVADDETPGRAREGIPAAPERAVLPDAAEAGVHEPARERLPGDRGEDRRAARRRAGSGCARRSAATPSRSR